MSQGCTTFEVIPVRLILHKPNKAQTKQSYAQQMSIVVSSEEQQYIT